MTPIWKISILKKTVKALNSSASHGDIIALKIKSSQSTSLDRKGYELSSKCDSTSTHAIITKLTKDGK